MDSKELSVVPSDPAIKKIIHYRFGAVQTNPVRKWQIDDKLFEFKRGTNNTKGLHMSRLGALVRHVFYDKKTQVIFTTEGPLNRRSALIDDPDFLDILRFEYKNDILFAPWIPHSLEYLAKIYKYLIQNVIEPDLDVDTLKNLIGNMVASTFNTLTTSGMEKEVLNAEERKILSDRKIREFKKFGHTLQEISDELRKYKPFRGQIISDSSDYSSEKNYDDPVKREQALRILMG